MHAHHAPRTLASVGIATLAALLLLAWFTLVVQEAQTHVQAFHQRGCQLQGLADALQPPRQLSGWGGVGQHLHSRVRLGAC